MRHGRRSVPADDARGGLGFIERCGAEYEALAIGRCCERRRFPTLDEAAASFSRAPVETAAAG